MAVAVYKYIVIGDGIPNHRKYQQRNAVAAAAPKILTFILNRSAAPLRSFTHLRSVVVVFSSQLMAAQYFSADPKVPGDRCVQ